MELDFLRDEGRTIFIRFLCSLCQKTIIRVCLKLIDNKEFFHIYNKQQSKCLSVLGTYLHVGDCNLQSCSQKWMWSADGKLMNANDFHHPMCISTNQPAESNVLSLESCSQNPLRWNCENELVKLRGYNLYLNYEKKQHDVNLLSSATNVSHWVRYSTRDNICSASKKGKNVRYTIYYSIRNNTLYEL